MSPLKKPKIKTEQTVVRQPKSKPKCVMHEVTMVYRPERGMWKCPVKGCKLGAWPPNVAEKGKPILGEGELELVLVRDPDGNKRPRTLLRTVEGNIMIDVTDYVTEVSVEREDDDTPTINAGQITMSPSVQFVNLTLKLFNITDTR